jgi:hypothetical protein
VKTPIASASASHTFNWNFEWNEVLSSSMQGAHLGALFKSRESGNASEPLPLSVFGAI